MWKYCETMEPDKILTWRYNIPITAQSFNTINDDLGNQRKNDEKDGWINDEVRSSRCSVFPFLPLRDCIHTF